MPLLRRQLRKKGMDIVHGLDLSGVEGNDLKASGHDANIKPSNSYLSIKGLAKEEEPPKVPAMQPEDYFSKVQEQLSSSVFFNHQAFKSKILELMTGGKSMEVRILL
mmetsp:Transcript_34867/g.53535  ORF Transcript_34867/g.53535 Transcript_34867/m.53535 type:complete len:107 (-) Transcript_34867:873-1193(-)